MSQILPPPSTFGLPPSFPSWRVNQDAAIVRCLDSPYRFVTAVCPTGFGKSLMYVTAALLHGGRAVFLTSTKGLQSQLFRDFSSIGMVDVRGRNNYRCIAETDGTTCDHGVCSVGHRCIVQNECLYTLALRAARSSSLVVTNYAAWMHLNAKLGDPLGKFDVIVCDEAHDTHDIVSSFLSITLDRKDGGAARPYLQSGDLSHLSIEEWKKWANHNLPAIEAAAANAKAQARSSATRYSRRKAVSLKRLEEDVASISRMGEGWAVDAGEYEVVFCPVWPAPYCEKVLFLGVPHVILTSASICDKTMELIGVPPGVNDCMEYPHTFPVSSRRLIHIPTVRMNYRTTREQLGVWVTRIDQIIGQRLDRKGIVHTVSYDRRNFLLANSKHSHLFITHKRQDTEAMVEEFKRAAPPSVLVSPSMTTGWDFPDDDCYFQIIGKLSYPDTRSNIVRARTVGDRDYGAYIAMQQLVQACGRPVRSETDWCETFIIDDNATWFMRSHGKFAPAWFMEAYGGRSTIPQPPPLSSPSNNGFRLLTPGTAEWRYWWRDHPDQQMAMLRFSKQRR